MNCVGKNKCQEFWFGKSYIKDIILVGSAIKMWIKTEIELNILSTIYYKQILVDKNIH